MKKIAVIGIIVLISISPLFRGLYFCYETYAFLAALALFSTLYFFSKIVKHEPVCFSKLFVSMGVLLLTAIVFSYSRALNPRENLGSLLLYAQLLVIFIVLYDYFHDKKQQFILSIMLPVLFTGFICAVAGLITLVGEFRVLEAAAFYGRVGSTFQYANTAAIYFAICFLFAVTLINASESIILKVSAAAAGNTVMYAFFLTASRGGYIVGIAFVLLLLAIQPAGRKLGAGVGFVSMLAPVLITIKYFNISAAAHDSIDAAKWLAVSLLLAAVSYLAFYLLLRVFIKDKHLSMRNGHGFIFAASFAVVIIAAFVFRNNLLTFLPAALGKRIARLALNDINILYRLDYDKDALKLIAANWLSGLGGGGWKALYQSVQDYFYTAVFVHNHYLQIFVEHGIAGFLSFVAMALLSSAGAFYSFLKSRDDTVKTYAAGLLCGLLALLVHAAVDFDLSFVSLLLLLWMMFAAAAVSQPDGSDKTGGGKTVVSGNIGKMALVVAGSVLFSLYALYTAGAFSEHTAYTYMQKKDYAAALTYYEEANRLDPANTLYTFELAKLYHFYAGKSANESDRKSWLEKSRTAGEFSVGGSKCYPAYMNTLVRIYLDSDMPLQALDYSRKLVEYQKYNAEVYELLAGSYIAAARYYMENGDEDSAREMLAKCVDVDANPYLHRSKIKKPYDVNSEKIISSYKHSEKLSEYLTEAENMLDMSR